MSQRRRNRVSNGGVKWDGNGRSYAPRDFSEPSLRLGSPRSVVAVAIGGQFMTDSQFDHRGWVSVPPRIAAWLETKSGITVEFRDRLRDTDLEAHRVLCAIHAAAMSVSGPSNGRDRARNGPSNTWLSTTEAAKAAGVQDRTVRRWINSGSLPARLQASRWLISSTDLNEFLREKGRYVDAS